MVQWSGNNPPFFRRDFAPDHWNALVPEDSPILQHQFLTAFERTGCVIPDTGWEPHHLAIYHTDHLLAAAPCYLKYHSYGEYIFDWDWAHAYQQAGLNYYPKILLAIPFTPITGKRLLIHPDSDTPIRRRSTFDGRSRTSGKNFSLVNSLPLHDL